MEVVATAGHVDHGKSALVRALTGMEPDRFDEEHRRGLTIDLGYVWADLPTAAGPAVTVAFVDVPGHEDFLRNMLSGASVVGRSLLVVAADEGLQAQSEEHLQIIGLLGHRIDAAVVSKADLAGDARTAATVAAVADRLAVAGFDDVPVVAADAMTATGIDEVRATLADRLRARPTPPATGGARLWVDRAFTVRGAGTVATGTLQSGTLRIREDLALLPGGTVGRVRGLQSLGREVAEATAPARVAVNLGGVPRERLSRGAALVGVEAGAPTGLASAHLDVELRALGHARIGARGAWQLHLGTAVAAVRVRPLLDDVEPGTTGPARLEIDEPLPARVGDRFVVRDAGRRTTAGGGVVLDPDPPPRPRGAERRLTHALVLERVRDADDVEHRVAALVDAHGGVRRLPRLRAALGGEVAVGDGLVEISGHVVRRDLLAAWLDAAGAAAADGAPEHALAVSVVGNAAIDVGCPPGLAEAVVDRAVTEGRLARHGGRIVHSGHEATYLAARARRQAALVTALSAHPWDPPEPAAAAEELGVPWFEVRSLIDDGTLVECGPLLLAASAVPDAVARLHEGPGRDGAAFTASEARRAWGNTRRCAVPLLEHLRTVGVTTFDGRHHRLRRG